MSVVLRSERTDKKMLEAMVRFMEITREFTVYVSTEIRAHHGEAAKLAMYTALAGHLFLEYDELDRLDAELESLERTGEWMPVQEKLEREIERCETALARGVKDSMETALNLKQLKERFNEYFGG